MNLDPDVCYRALRARDARFDGRFFTAVRSTGVYCRPVCPARTPRRENCWFVPCAAAAQEAGFRPCLRCRPEASPGTPAWLGTSATVSRALRLIGEGALDSGGVDDLASRLGVGGRHLRRLFASHLGASPLAVAQTRRVLFAKKLIDETNLALTEVAFAAGFSSVRRFNAALRDTYGRAPRELRRKAEPPVNGRSTSDISLRLPYRPPLDWRALLAFFAARATPGVEAVEGDRYRRTISLDGASGTVEVRPAEAQPWLEARIRLSSPAILIQVTERLRHTFDLGCDPDAVAAHLGRDATLRPLVARRPGLRVPGAWDGFELAVRAILGQQVSVRGATTLAGRLVAAFGAPLELDRAAPGDLTHLFPTPEALAGADLTRIGLPRARAGAIAALAERVAKGVLHLDHARGVEEAVETLSALPGIGEWTAQYVAMRALREPDAFPAGDLGLRRAFARGDTPASEADLRRAAEPWRPWRAYAALQLWNADAPKASGRRNRVSSNR